jgi:hypothetical protein
LLLSPPGKARAVTTIFDQNLQKPTKTTKTYKNLQKL